MQPQLYSGARTTVQINGETVAAGFVSSWDISTSASELDTVDTVFPVELVPDRIRVAMQIRVYRTPDNDPVVLGIAPGGSMIGQAEQAAFTQSRYIQILVKDNLDQTILHIPKAWITRRSVTVSTGDFMTENWSITGIGYYGPPAT